MTFGSGHLGAMRNGFLASLLILVAGCSSMTKIVELPGTSPLGIAQVSATVPASAITSYQDAAREVGSGDKLTSFLDAARLSFDGAIASRGPERKIYNASCAEAAALIHEMIRGKGNSIRIPDSYDVTVRDVHARNFLIQEKVHPSERVEVKNLKEEIIMPGIGGALVAYTSKANEMYSGDPNISSEGLTLSLTSVLSFPEPGKAVLEIRDPEYEDDLVIGEVPLKLTSDYTTPLAYLSSQAPKRSVSFEAMINPAENEWIRGLFRFEPVDSKQIPVVFIHGLQSSPRIWKDVYLKIIRDEKIRENYQFWCYRYPTGYGVGFNAQRFRAAFEECMKLHDPGGTNPNFNETILVGHSMGGLLTSASIRSSEDIIWNLLSDRESPEELNLDEATRKELESAIFFEPLPQVSRAVFMAVPHRGSRLASGAPGKLGASLIRLPLDLISSVGSSEENLEGLTSFGIEAFTSNMTSIDALKPHGWQLETLLTLPISERVTMHSIIGRVKEHRALDKSSDGVVPYWSSHLDGVESELVVKSCHNVPECPEAIAELQRILHLHLEKLGR